MIQDPNGGDQTDRVARMLEKGGKFDDCVCICPSLTRRSNEI